VPARILLRSGILEHPYNSLLNLKFARRTKTIEFADDLILSIRGETVSEAEKFSNLERSKVIAWSKNNKTIFNAEKSKVMLNIEEETKRSKRN
jgi:hypothetical protein